MLGSFSESRTLIFRNYLLSALPESDKAALTPNCMEVSLGGGEIVFEPDRPVEFVLFPSTTVLSEVRVMADGRQVETATIGVESLSGLLSALTGEPARNRTFAQIAGGAIRLPAARLRAQAAASAPLMHLLLRHLHANSAQAEQSVACNALHHVAARLARWLLMTSDRTGRPTVALTQDYLAVMVGAQRTTVSGGAAALKARGLIRYSRGQIDIIDRAGLEHAACECYAAVREAYDDLLPRR
jgi:CRP-like cAMP-binding protein